MDNFLLRQEALLKAVIFTFNGSTLSVHATVADDYNDAYYAGGRRR